MPAGQQSRAQGIGFNPTRLSAGNEMALQSLPGVTEVFQSNPAIRRE